MIFELKKKTLKKGIIICKVMYMNNIISLGILLINLGLKLRSFYVSKT